MNTAVQKPATSRITRSRLVTCPEAVKKSKKTLQKCTKLSVIIQQPISISPVDNGMEHQRFSDLNQKIESLTAANKTTETTMLNFMNEFQAIRRTIELLQADNAALKIENLKLSDDIRTVFDDMDYTMGKIQNLEQKTLANNIEISGIPATEDEDLSAILQRLFEHTDYQCSETTIKDAYRTKPTKQAGLPGNIIVIFDNQTNKNGFMKKIKGKQLSSDSIGSSHCRPIYINDHLTRLNKYLMYLARSMRRHGDIKFVWFENGKVLVKKSEGMESIVVECPRTLDRLRSQ
jgi:hypothetical protein